MRKVISYLINVLALSFSLWGIAIFASLRHEKYLYWGVFLLLLSAFPILSRSDVPLIFRVMVTTMYYGVSFFVSFFVFLFIVGSA